MRPVYQRRPLASDEVLALAAYLEDTGAQATEDSPPLPLKFLLPGLGATLLALVAVGTLRGSRSGRRNQVTAPATQDFAPPPGDFIGAGL
jgi:hypothetical protein